MTQKTFSFTIPMSNPDARRFLGAKEDIACRVATEQAPAVDAPWEAVPQPQGIWVHGEGKVPASLIETVQMFIENGVLEEVRFEVEGDAPETVEISAYCVQRTPKAEDASLTM